MKKIFTQKTQNSPTWMKQRNQYVTMLIVNLIMFSHGMVSGWPTTAMPILTSDETPLESGPLPVEEISWIGSINSIGGIIGTLAFGYIVSLMGSKHAISLLTIPEIAFWLLIYFGNHYYYILVGRTFDGFTGAGTVPLTLFISEIANDNIRGRLSTSLGLTKNIGRMTSHILGSTFSFCTIPRICIGFPIAFFIIFQMLPNTPQYHLRRGKIQKAENTLKFYKSYKGKSEQENVMFFNEFERLKTIANESKAKERLRPSDFWSKEALNGFVISFTLTVCKPFTANQIISTYAVKILNQTGTTIDSFQSLIMISSALIAGSFLSTYLADILGRKILNIISLVGSAIGLFTVAIYHYFYLHGYNMSAFVWIPVVSLSFVIFISSAGIISLAGICSIEYLPTKIRTSGYVIIYIWSSILNFTFDKLFPIVLETIDLHRCMAILGSGSILAVFFVAFAMEETSGKSLDDVASSTEKNETQIE